MFKLEDEPERIGLPIGMSSSSSSKANESAELVAASNARRLIWSELRDAETSSSREERFRRQLVLNYAAHLYKPLRDQATMLSIWRMVVDL